MKWTNTIEAVIEVEAAGTKGQWRIGDAIIKDLKENGIQFNGETEIKSEVFTEAAEALAGKGVINHSSEEPYTNTHVRLLFQTAAAFPREERNPKYSWSVHLRAGTPANLRRAVSALGKIGKRVNPTNVHSLLMHWADEADNERRKTVEKAKATREVARSKKAKASEEKLAAKTEKAREEAEERRQEAKREIEQATKAIKEAGGPPRFNADVKIDETDVGALSRWAIYLGIVANTMQMKRQAQKTLKELGRIAKDLTPTEQQKIADGISQIIDILDEISVACKRPPARKLTAIQGGRAS